MVPGDSEQPGVKSRFTSKGGEFFVGLNKRFLGDIRGISPVSQESGDRVKDSFLVFSDQLTEGIGVAVQTFLDELLVVSAHNFTNAYLMTNG